MPSLFRKRQGARAAHKLPSRLGGHQVFASSAIQIEPTRLPVLQVPTERSLPPLPSLKGARQPHSTYNVCLSAFKTPVLFGRWQSLTYAALSAETDSPDRHRTTPDLEGIVISPSFFFWEGVMGTFCLSPKETKNTFGTSCLPFVFNNVRGGREGEHHDLKKKKDGVYGFVRLSALNLGRG